ETHSETEDHVLAELPLSTVATAGVLIVPKPALNHALGGGRDDALDAMPGHEVEAPGASAHDRLPDLDRRVDRTWHQGDLLQAIASVGNVGRNRVVLALVREGFLPERLHDDLHLFLEQLAVRLGVQHGVAEALHFATVIAASDPEDDPPPGQ